jgi:hypothetical protein
MKQEANTLDIDTNIEELEARITPDEGETILPLAGIKKPHR